ncbi:peptide/nickel transport system permease protein [Saccharopolyspora kobensis]|uniref:Peptide/nickel transport system permease protein n=1 Tax=Saccharopolyspora kobensis TaxID=146035 RepID=A0A1H5T4R2_9PSEU|nr:ABC transporter permease subunit [Saccharopolyspora kobensis]SEF57749.1 peptide/nickel transport system permease protein [Saccharopolyspora kobensis]SFC50394.1 peptide/nickel transport system permease protein [Saccharopolyspora kobensis]
MRRPSVTVVVGTVLLGVPALIALAGPLLAGPVRSRARPMQPPDAAFPLGTDVLGRDVLALALSGGASIVGLTGAALLMSYSIGVPLALLLAERRAGGILLRALDFLLALPGLLVLMVLAAAGWRGAVALALVIALLQLPAVVRIVRSAALAPGCRAAVEAMTMQGEPWWRIHLGYVGRCVLGPVLVDAGTRLSLVLYLLASANFLGLGLAPSASDWAVLVERNKEALFLQPPAVLVPACLLVSLCTGVNLLLDHALARGNEA